MGVVLIRVWAIDTPADGRGVHARGTWFAVFCFVLFLTKNSSRKSHLLKPNSGYRCQDVKMSSHVPEKEDRPLPISALRPGELLQREAGGLLCSAPNPTPPSGRGYLALCPVRGHAFFLSFFFF